MPVPAYEETITTSSGIIVIGWGRRRKKSIRENGSVDSKYSKYIPGECRNKKSTICNYAIRENSR
jgi:hypothetical protein